MSRAYLLRWIGPKEAGFHPSRRPRPGRRTTLSDYLSIFKKKQIKFTIK